MQVGAPVLAEKVPWVQALHSFSPEFSENVPGEQSVQEVADGVFTAFPGGQSVQARVPVPLGLRLLG